MKCPDCQSLDTEKVDSINGAAKYECQKCGYQFWDDELDPNE